MSSTAFHILLSSIEADNERMFLLALAYLNHKRLPSYEIGVYAADHRASKCMKMLADINCPGYKDAYRKIVLGYIACKVVRHVAH